MLWSWFRDRRRRRWLSQPFPADWATILERNVKQSRWLPADLSSRWRQLVQAFVNETTWEGCRGFVITDELRVTIAGYATLLVLGWPNECLDGVRHVLVHPTPYQGRRARIGVEGVDYSHGDWMQQLEDDVEDEHLGEAWFESGTVILVWSEVPTSEHITPSGQNVVLHEFAHVMHERRADWLASATTQTGEKWTEVFLSEFERQQRDSERGHRTLLDDYAAESPEEFFCVATECFWERPTRMKEQTPTLETLLRQFYGVSAADWAGRQRFG